MVVYNLNKILVEDPKAATALVQALAKSKFEFHVGRGITKKCGEDYFNVEIPKEAKVKKHRGKEKGIGKKSAPGHNSAQDQDPDILDLEITKEDNEILNETDKPTAGPSNQAGEKKGDRGRKKEKEIVPVKTDGKPKRKRRSSPKHRWIKFFHAAGTPDAEKAKEDRRSHQLQVHGLPSEFLEPTPAGPQE